MKTPGNLKGMEKLMTSFNFLDNNSMKNQRKYQTYFKWEFWDYKNMDHEIRPM